jgi:DNA-binding NtrC family response regulator
MTGMDGVDLLRLLKKRAPSVDVVLMTVYHDMPTVVQAMKGVGQLAARRVNVLIRWETGSGKGVVARALLYHAAHLVRLHGLRMRHAHT